MLNKIKLFAFAAILGMTTSNSFCPPEQATTTTTTAQQPMALPQAFAVICFSFGALSLGGSWMVKHAFPFLNSNIFEPVYLFLKTLLRSCGFGYLVDTIEAALARIKTLSWEQSWALCSMAKNSFLTFIVPAMGMLGIKMPAAEGSQAPAGAPAPVVSTGIPTLVPAGQPTA